MTTQQQWDTSTPITDLIGATPEDTDDLNDLCIPQWLDQTISPYQVQSINQGGCDDAHIRGCCAALYRLHTR